MSIALILNTYITCHFPICIFESFISGSHSPLYPFSVLLWQAWGAYDGTCLLSSSSAHSGQGLGAGGWGHLSPVWVSCDHRWGQRPILLAFPHPTSPSLPHPLPFSSLSPLWFSTSSSFFTFHCDFLFTFFCFWLHRVTCVTSSPTSEWTQAIGNESPES